MGRIIIRNIDKWLINTRGLSSSISQFRITKYNQKISKLKEVTQEIIDSRELLYPVGMFTFENRISHISISLELYTIFLLLGVDFGL